MRDDIVSPTSVEIDVIVNEKQKREYAQSLPVYSVRDDTDRDNRLTDSIKMAKFVANKISSLINTEIYDTNAKKMRKVEYKDISILSRKLESQKVRDLIEELKSNQLPVTVEQNIDVGSSESIQILLSLAKLINYSTADNDYVSAMLSFGGFNFQQLNIIAGEKGETFLWSRSAMGIWTHYKSFSGDKWFGFFWCDMACGKIYFQYVLLHTVKIYRYRSTAWFWRKCDFSRHF